MLEYAARGNSYASLAAQIRFVSHAQDASARSSLDLTKPPASLRGSTCVGPSTRDLTGSSATRYLAPRQSTPGLVSQSSRAHLTGSVADPERASACNRR